MATNALRIAHVVCSDEFAGVERYVSTVAPELAVRGHRVTVIGGSAERTTAALAGTGVSHIAARRADHATRVLLRRGRRFDLIHAHMTAAEAAAAVTRPIVRRPIVCTRHFAALRGSTIAGRLLRQPIYHALAEQVSISRFVAESINEPSTLLPNCVPDGVRVDPALQSDVVLVAQRLEVEKQTVDALEAWRAAGLAEHGWELWVAGDGAQRRTLERRSERLAGVRFLGYRADVDDLLRQSAIMLATAPLEPFGLSVAEAMAVGLPVIAADGGGHRETVGAVAADMLYPPGDTDRCARVLRGLAADPERRRTVGDSLRDFQQREFGVSQHVDRLIEVYARAMGAAS